MVVALHDVAAGHCSCLLTTGRDCGTSAGKHPVGKDWTARGLRSGADVEVVFSERPMANVGIMTGPGSGIFALDVDVKNGGPESLAALERQYGRLPLTWRSRTGGGGYHLVFAWPALAAGLTIKNSESKLGPGLDIRGVGGQIVAPPSVTLFGSYTVETEVAAAAPPGWLVDLVAGPESVTVPALPQPFAGVIVDSSGREIAGGRDALAPEVAERSARYAATAVEAELGKLLAAGPGTRNPTAFAVACNLHELLNSAWSGLHPGAVWSRYEQACARIGFGLGQDAAGNPADTPGEHVTTWHKASARVGGRARPLPDFRPGAEILGLAVPPFGQTSIGASPQRGPIDGGVVALPPVGDIDPVDAMIGAMLDSAALDDIPDPSPLIRDWLYLDAVSWVIGRSGEGKSFVTLDMAGAVGTGRTWHGHPVRQGPVVYMVAEGARGVRKRVRAWESYHGTKMTGVHFLPFPVQAGEHEWWVFTEACRRLGAVMVIVDTQARVTVGREENSAKDMGVFIHALEELRRVTSASVVVVHHMGHTGDNARGSTALKGAAQSELRVSKDGDLVTLRTNKQKDEADESVMTFVAKVVEVGRDELNTPVTSIVMQGAGDSIEAAIEAGSRHDDRRAAEKLSGRHLLAAIMMDTFYAGDGGTQSQVHAEFKARGGTRTTFYRVWGELCEEGMIGRVASKSSYRWVPSDERERLTRTGEKEWTLPEI